MKNLILTCLFLSSVTAGKILAQNAGNESAIREKMKIFAGWNGQWKGEGAMRMGPGEPKKSSVDERVEMRLDGNLVIVEGVGKTSDPETKTESVVHHAFGVISYDMNNAQYKFKTYLKDGRGTDAWFNVLGENSYQWGFDFPGRKTRYTITIDPSKKTWNEIGESSTDGNNWIQFFEMNLTKVN